MMDRDTITRTGARAPGVERQCRLHGGVPRTASLDSERGYDVTGSEVHEGRTQTVRRDELVVDGKAPSDIPALKPYWGKPAVRNFRGTMETSASFEARSAPSSYPAALTKSWVAA